LPGVVGFIDVVDDGLCAPNDALAVINYINANRPPPGGGGEGLASGESQSSGVRQVLVPGSAAEYLAVNGALWRSAPGGDEPCTCSDCVGARTDAAIAGLGAPAANDSLAGFSSLEIQPLTKNTTSKAARPIVLDAPLVQARSGGLNRARQAFLARGPADDSEGKPHRDAAVNDEVIATLLAEGNDPSAS
jgi:hypothetical protein